MRRGRGSFGAPVLARPALPTGDGFPVPWPAMRLILVRHGEAHAGCSGPIAGRTGWRGLTPYGRLQAEALREHLAATGRVRADVLIASVLPRAIETAEIIAPGLGLEVSSHDCDLCEVHTGEADGVDWSQYND